MKVEYKVDADKSIIGHIMPNFIKASFVEKFIRHSAETMCDLFRNVHRKKYGVDLGGVELEKMWICCLEKAKSQYDELVKNSPCPDEIVRVFSYDLRKREQVNLLKGLALKEEQLASIFYKAEELGYTISQIRFEGMPKNYSLDELPRFAYLDDDGSVVNVGGDTLSEGQIKALITQAHVLIARIAEKDGHWHCFVQTFKGLKGEESGEQGSRPHIHYLSDKFCNLTFEDLMSMLEQGNYPHTPVHLPLI